MKRILIASSNTQAVDAISARLKNEFDLAICREGLPVELHKGKFELVFLDINLLKVPEGARRDFYRSALHPFREAYPGAAIVIISSEKNTRQAVDAVRAGAEDYLTSPVGPEEVKYVLEHTYENLRKKQELAHLRDEFWMAEDSHVVNTRSPAMQSVFAKIKSVANTITTVLLTGETGTGKGVLAQLIHKYSNRRGGPFINVHCGAIPENLIESELFGHEKGAFTGAIRKKLGKFELAAGGTIFLDEISTISPSAQIKLLKVLQEKSLNRVGGEEDIRTDVRIVAASNVDLKNLCDNGSFRKDLFYRLNVFPIVVTPLKNRSEDISMLSEGIIQRLNLLNLKGIEGLHPQVLAAFHRYSWPGNIRELENLIERACILESSNILTPESFPAELFQNDESERKILLDTSKTLANARREGIESLERSYLKAVLEDTHGKIKAAAGKSGITTRQLHKLMSRYGIRKEDFKHGGAPSQSKKDEYGKY